MKTHKTIETDNLVLFPSAKNYAETLEAELSDPMIDLLNEYSHISDDQIPAYLDDRFENENEDDGDNGEDSLAFESLEAFMNRNQAQEQLSPDDRLARMINERLEAINEARERIKFYLDEIDMFLPRRR